MLVVGLTGGIATGKSTVSTLLKSRHIPVIDADILAREVVKPGTPALTRIVQKFGQEILLENGELDRKTLGRVVFGDEEKRRVLNGIVHPAVRKRMCWEVIKCWVMGERVCVVDVPLLIEGGLWKWVGMVVVVFCPAEVQLERLMKRDGLTLEDASSRLSAQLPISAKLPYADEVIDNSGSLAHLHEQIEKLTQKVDGQVGFMWRLSWLCPPFGILCAVWRLTYRAMSYYGHRLALPASPQ